MLSFIDSHCHFDFDVFDCDREQLWQRCRDNGVQQLVIPGVNPVGWAKCQQLACSLPGISMAAGLHPWWAGDFPCGYFNQQEQQCWEAVLDEPYCVAVGECGLDKSITTPLPLQQMWFEQHINMACMTALPMIVHVRHAHNEVLALLEHYRPKGGGVIHAFSGSLALALRYWRLGFFLGIGGSITYERAVKTRHTVAELPLESMVLETDSPDMPLAGYQGRRNDPARIPLVAQTLASLREQPLAVIAQQTTLNSQQLFRL